MPKNTKGNAVFALPFSQYFFGFKPNYLKNESTNSYLLKT